MANQAINPADVDWANRAAKRYADELAFRAIAPWVRAKTTPIDVLSLPADRWLWEMNMANLFPDQTFGFFGVEKDEVVHERMNSTAKQLRLAGYNLHPCAKPEAIIDWVTRAKGVTKLDMVYFDWMGSWSEDKETQLKRLFASDILKKDSIFRFTVGLSRGKSSKWTHLMDEIQTQCFHIVDIRGEGEPIPEWRLYGVPQLAINLASLYGDREMELISAHVYGGLRPNLGQSVPEISFTFAVA